MIRMKVVTIAVLLILSVFPVMSRTPSGKNEVEEIIFQLRCKENTEATKETLLTSVVASLESNYNYSGYHWPNSSIPVPYYINTSLPSLWIQTIRQSFQTWEEVSGSFMNYSYQGTTAVVSPTPHFRDNINLISYSNIDGPNNVLAYCACWCNTTSKIILESDIVIDSSENWSVTPSCPTGFFDLQSAVTHEIGHTLMLNDLYDSVNSEQTMYGYMSTNETKKRTLAEGDIAGIRYIYPSPLPLIHDVAVISVLPAKTLLPQGETLPIAIIVANQGQFSENFNVTAYANDNAIGTQPVLNLYPNSSRNLSFYWNTSMQEGSYVIKANASQVPGETNLSDNSYTYPTAVRVVIPIHDIAIVNATLSKSLVSQNYPLTISVIVENRGTFNEIFNVTIYSNNSVMTFFSVGLAMNSTKTIEYKWYTIGLGIGTTYNISVAAGPLPEENATANNYCLCGIVSVTMVGDVNNDFKVDIQDIARVSASFGSFPGQPKWNPIYDLDDDGKVDVSDIAVVAHQFGKHIP